MSQAEKYNGRKRQRGFVVWTDLLRQNSSHPHIGHVDLYDELSFGVWLDQDRWGGEEFFRFGECLVCFA